MGSWEPVAKSSRTDVVDEIMCGIAGIVHYNDGKMVDAALLAGMTDSLFHRGPDDRGIHIDGSVGLGFRRLSILDLSPAGHQPMTNEDRSLWLVCNGEIFNFKKLRKELENKGHIFNSETDSETIVHGYEEWGEDVVHHLDGMFAFALWDSRQKTLLAARDRFGIKPFVYALWNDGFAFASEIKSLLVLPWLPRELNPRALWYFLSLAQIPAPDTIYQGVHKLLPGHRLICRGKRLQTQVYYRLPFMPDSVLASEDDCVEELRQKLVAAVTSHLVADVPVGCFLSGGLDSSLLAAMAARINPGIKTFSVTFPENAQHNEESHQLKVARAIGSDHYVLEGRLEMTTELAEVYRSMDEPFAISSFLPLASVARLASQYVKVVLSGDGADEMFGGYDRRYIRDMRLAWLRWFPHMDRGAQAEEIWGAKTLSGRIRRQLRLAGQPEAERYISSYNWFTSVEKKILLQEEMQRRTPADLSEYSQRYFRRDVPGAVRRRMYYECQSCLPDEMLRKTDGATSAVGIEGRVPFLDLALAEWAWTLPTALHWRNGRGKQLLRRVARGLLPDEIINRPKAGFNIPVYDWVSADKHPVQTILSESVPAFDQIVRPDAVRTLMKSVKMGRQDLSSRLWVLAILKVWIQQHPLLVT